MNINNFDQEIDPKILKRGREYFANGAVEELEDLGDGRYQAVINGSYQYLTTVALSKDGDIYNLACDCPYELGDICKHEVAALLAIRNEPIQTQTIPSKKRKIKNKKETDLREVLMQQTQETLVDIIFSLTERDDAFKQSLLLRFSTSDDELALSKKLIKESIRQQKKRGYIEYNKVFSALAGAWDVINRAENYIESDPMRAATLCLLVLHEVFAMTQYADDSGGGEMGEAISYTMSVMHATVLEGSKFLSKQSRDELFNIILKETDNEVYNGWFVDNEFYAMLTPLCGDPALYAKLWNELEKKISAAKHQIEQERALLQQFQLLNQWGSREESQHFLREHIQYYDFRKHAIRTAMEQKDYATALRYAQEGIAQDSKAKNSNYVHRWQRMAFEAYKAMGNIDKMCELAEHFILHDHDGMDYYGILKENTPTEKWAAVLQRLFVFYDSQGYTLETYPKILIIEKEYDRLLSFCRKQSSRIVDFAAQFPDKYKQAVEELYTAFLLQAAENAKDRQTYRLVCKYLKDFGRICGQEKAYSMVQQLKIKYSKRPAFLDELEKI